MLAPLTRGLTVVIPQSLTGPQIIRALQEGEINVVIGVPRLYRALYSGIQARLQSAGPLRGGIARKLLMLSIALRRRFGVRAGKILLRPLHRQLGSQLRLLASGGAALDPELAMKLEGLGWQVAIGYGLTETSPLLTFNLPGQAPLDSVGKPIRGVELRIRTPEKEERVGGLESQGEVLARGPSVFTGYRNLEEKTREAFTEDGWFRTGDLGFMDEAGELFITGRIKDVIIVRGINYYPQDIENTVYDSHPALRRYCGAVFSVLTENTEEKIVLVQEVERVHRRDLEIDEIIGCIREAVVNEHEIALDSILLIRPGSIPKTTSGKIQRNLARRMWLQNSFKAVDMLST